MTLVRATRLAELGVVSGHVEDVVDDLEQDAELGRKAAERDCGRSARAAEVTRRTVTDAAISRPVFSSCRRRRPRGVQVAVGGHVEELAAHHPADARGGRQLARAGEHVGRLAGLLGERQPQRLGEQAVAGEDRHVLAERHVAGGLAAAQVVVVHGRQVVVDERVGVDHLDRRRERQHVLGVAPERLGRGQGQHRPDALAARQQRVAHGLHQPRDARLVAEAQLLEVVVHPLLELDRIGAAPASRRAGSWCSQQPLLALRGIVVRSASRPARSSSAPTRPASSAQRSTSSAACGGVQLARAQPRGRVLQLADELVQRSLTPRPPPRGAPRPGSRSRTPARRPRTAPWRPRRPRRWPPRPARRRG